MERSGMERVERPVRQGVAGCGWAWCGAVRSGVEGQAGVCNGQAWYGPKGRHGVARKGMESYGGSGFGKVGF